MWQNATTKERNGSGSTIPHANPSIKVRASEAIKLMPAGNLPRTRRLCSQLSGGKDPRSCFLATETITFSSPCLYWPGTVRPIIARSREALPLVLV